MNGALLTNGNSKQLLIDTGIKLKNLKHLLSSKSLGQMCGMSFLPHKLSCAKEWGCLLRFPTDDRVPLVKAEGQIAMASNPLGVVCIAWVLAMIQAQCYPRSHN